MLIRFKLILMALIWGGTFVAGRSLAGRVDPMVASFVRFAMAASVLLVIVRIKEGRLPALPKKLILPVSVLGLTGIALYSVFFFTGLHYTTAGKASLIVATNPILVGLIAGIFFGEGMSPFRIMGIFLSVCGAVIVISDGRPALLLHGGLSKGELLIFGCVASWVVYSLVGKNVTRVLTPLTAVTYAVTVGAVFLLGPALYSGLLPGLREYAAADWGSLAFLAVGGTVLGYLWYYEGIRLIGASRAAVFINLVPVFGVLLGAVLLGEQVGPWLVGGGALVIGGVWLTQRGR